MPEISLPEDFGKLIESEDGVGVLFPDEDGEEDSKVFQVRQNIDPYPLATEVKLLWDRQERIGMIVPPSEHDYCPGEVTQIRVGKGEDAYSTVAVVSPYGEVMQAVFWSGEDGLGFWSPEYLLPKDFDFTKRPAVTITQHSMYVIRYYDNLILEEGFMFIKSDDDPDAGSDVSVVPF